MINNTLVNSSNITVPVKVFQSTDTGQSGGTGQSRAITTMILCNTNSVTLNDETADELQVNVYLVRSGDSPASSNLIVNNLTVPASETIFFSDEKIILDSDDEIWIGTSTANELSVTVSTLQV